MSRRSFKLPVQPELPKMRERDKNDQFRGGARPGAGRPKRKGRRSSEPHTIRPQLKASQPVHVVMRAAADVGSLRTMEGFAAVREARASTLRLEDSFRIIHFTIQRNHIHLIVEAHDRKALSKGMQVFGISCAKQLNAAITARRGVRVHGPLLRAHPQDAARGPELFVVRAQQLATPQGRRGSPVEDRSVFECARIRWLEGAARREALRGPTWL